jgi:hypothetical protein
MATAAGAATNVGGIISASTTWTAAGSPYVLTAKAQVAPGATLAIDPGVEVQGNGLGLEIYGTLDASGTADAPVIFRETHIRPGVNTSSQPFTIAISNASITGGSVYAPTGNAVYGHLVLTDSVVENVGMIYLWYPVADCVIERNILSGVSLSIGHNGPSVYVRNNVLRNSSIENWVSYAGNTVVQFNTFTDVGSAVVSLARGYTGPAMNAQYNYWGTTDPNVIQSMIFDRNDDLGCTDVIPFVPFLSEPHPDTPTLPTSTTSSTTTTTISSALPTTSTTTPTLAQQDKAPPSLVNLAADRTQIDTGAHAETVVFTAHLTDDVSGVLFMNVGCFSPTLGQLSSRPNGTRVSGNALDGMYTVAVTLPQFAEYGLWRCEFQADDVVRNRLDLQGSQLVALGFTGFISNGGTPDDTSRTTTTIWTMPPTTSTTMPSWTMPPTTSTTMPNTPLHASLAITPAMVLTGQVVTFDASASSAPLSNITHYEWDLDGDGTFDTDTGTVAVVSRSYSEFGEVQVQVRVTSDGGITDIAEGTLTVRQAPPPGPVGVSINAGAQFTNDPNVTVSVRWPAFATSLLIANDGGFLDAVAVPVDASIAWTLDASGPERLPKTIYVRFQGGESGPETYQDDIILDQTPPSVEGARCATRGRGDERRYRLRISASDDLSGVAQMQITNDASEPGDLVPFEPKTEVRTRSRKLLVRVQDLAGNLSPWRKVRR